MQPQVGQPGQFYPNGASGGCIPATVQTVDSATQVDCYAIAGVTAGWARHSNVPYVQADGTPPATGAFFKEIELRSPPPPVV